MIVEKTLEIHLKELREQLAREIESHMPHGKMCDITLALYQAAAIVRGKNK
jgi:hypothetical protein